MSDIQKRPFPSVPSSLYDENYYRSSCDGYQEFADGDALTPRLREILQSVTIGKDQKVLDIGCGRGEVIRHIGRLGLRTIGIDYSSAAVAICRRHLAGAELGQDVAVLRASAVDLPFSNSQYDIVFMLDLVEHLYPPELAKALSEAYRVLKAHGQLLIHTAPNLWYYKFGYRIYRMLRRLQGQSLPRDPKDRFTHHHAMHVNEQSPLTLRRNLIDSGFTCRIWVAQMQSPSLLGNDRWIRRLAYVATHFPLMRWFFCGDIYAVARKAP